MNHLAITGGTTTSSLVQRSRKAADILEAMYRQPTRRRITHCQALDGALCAVSEWLRFREHIKNLLALTTSACNYDLFSCVLRVPWLKSDAIRAKTTLCHRG
ncbi:hypothetical protein CBL_06093 [Carabus blaptoides fortunei]